MSLAIQPHPARLFISSVFGEMLDRRAWAQEVASLVGFVGVLPERFVAGQESIEAVLDRELALADTYVGLFSKRHGTVPGGEHWSVIEREFRTARDLGRRCLVLIEGHDHAPREPALRRFIQDEVLAFRTGVYPAYYGGDDRPEQAVEEELRLVLASSLAALTPMAHLWIRRSPSGMVATLFRQGLGPAIGDDVAEIGPLPIDLDLSPPTEAVLRRFLAGPMERAALREPELQFVGADLWSKLPPRIATALADVLALFSSHGRTLPLVVRTGDAQALAIPWELLSPPDLPLPVRSGALEVVRRFVAPGAGGDPGHDATPTPPSRDFSVLGFTAEPIEDEAQGVGQGAAGLRPDAKLFWEVEQERLLVALDPQLRTGGGTLTLPDTGEATLLAERLRRKDRPTLVHISCHGSVRAAKTNAGSDPAVAAPVHVLRLEDEEGRLREVGSDDLLGWLRAEPQARPVELIVLSACETASFGAASSSGGDARKPATEVGAEGRTGSLADELCRGGARRVLGMQASVSDSGASAFAGAFYARLAEGAPLTAALSAGRAAMRDTGIAHEWALPVLQVREHLGPLVAPPGLRGTRESPLELARKAFKIAGVSYLELGYVGRRLHDRRLRRAAQDGDPQCGRILVIHGFGGIGKSTLAARFLERRVQEGMRVIAPTLRAWTGAGLIAELAERLGVTVPDGTPPGDADRVRQTLAGRMLGAVPTVLLLDNFEDSQDPESGAVSDAALADVLQGLAIDGGGALLILVTSRIELTIPGAAVVPVNLDLGALSPAEARKLKLLQPGLREIAPPEWARVMHAIGGHPKALELLGGYLRGSPGRLEALLDSLDGALEHIEKGLANERQKRGRKLMLDEVVGSVPVERLATLDRLALLSAPLPSIELQAILEADGIATAAEDIAWLRGHGFLAMSAAPTALAGGDLVHRLVAVRRRESLREREGEEALRSFHRRVAQHFDTRPGAIGDFGIAAEHWDAAGDRAAALGRVDRLAVALRNGHAYRACATVAQSGLEQFPPRSVEAERLAAADVWLSVYDGCAPLGAAGELQDFIRRAVHLIRGLRSAAAQFVRGSVHLRRADMCQKLGGRVTAGRSFSVAAAAFRASGHPRDEAIALGGTARLRAQAGDLAGAQKMHEERVAVFERLGAPSERAVALSDVARLRAKAGDVTGAMKIYAEVLNVFGSLGEVSLRAVVLGDLAALSARAGNLDNATSLWEESLVVMRRLGEAHGVASTLFELGQLDVKSQNWDRAMERLSEAWSLVLKLGRVDGVAVVGELFGQLVAVTGDRAAGVKVLELSAAAWIKMGVAERAEQVAAMIGEIKTQA